jgi:hypothetical protein
MFRRAICAVVLGCAVCGVAAADDFYARITKVEGGKITFFRREAPKKAGGPAYFRKQAETLPLARDGKVLKAKFNREKGRFDPGEELPGGLKNEWLRDIEDPGVFCQIITDGENKAIKEVRVPPPVRKKKP